MKNILFEQIYYKYLSKFAHTDIYPNFATPNGFSLIKCQNFNFFKIDYFFLK